MKIFVDAIWGKQGIYERQKIMYLQDYIVLPLGYMYDTSWRQFECLNCGKNICLPLPQLTLINVPWRQTYRKTFWKFTLSHTSWLGSLVLHRQPGGSSRELVITGVQTPIHRSMLCMCVFLCSFDKFDVLFAHLFWGSFQL